MPTTTNENARAVRFDPDGEAIDLTDNANMQLFQQQRDWVALFAASLSHGAGDPSDPGSLATPESSVVLNERTLYGGSTIALHPGNGYVKAGGANALAILAGTIATVLDEPWNTGEDFAIFHNPVALSLATAVGDATHPRIDVVEIKLEYIDADSQTRHFEDATTRAPSSQLTDKERVVQMTYQIKAGTPAANPTYPACTVGFVPMAAVYVPATHNAVHAPENIRDLRMPVGIRAIDVLPNQMWFTGVNPWTMNGLLAAAAAASDPDLDRVVAICPVATKSARLIAIGVHGEAGGGDARAEIGVVNYPGVGAATYTALGSLANIFDVGLITMDSLQIADAIATLGTIKGVRTERAGTALWCNGQAGGMAHPGVAFNDGNEDPVRKLCVSLGDATGGFIGFVRFWIAEGL